MKRIGKEVQNLNILAVIICVMLKKIARKFMNIQYINGPRALWIKTNGQHIVNLYIRYIFKKFTSLTVKT